MIRKTIAFTLAETLIVMGIIGIVSALTLPNLNSSTGEKEKVAKVKKIYQNLNDAVGRAQAVYGRIDTWSKMDSTYVAQSIRFGERVTEFMKVSKNCGTAAGCFSTAPFKYCDGEEWNSNDVGDLINDAAYMVILADGTSLAFAGRRIRVDIDGPNKGKTTDGIDRFSFEVEDDGTVIPDGSNLSSTRNGSFDLNYDINVWVIENENLDYLKCKEKLNWNNKTSCK